MNHSASSIASILLDFSLVGIVVTGILYVVFGEVTVRKLRKNPETKGGLGVEFVSGWDIVNVAQTIALPRMLMRRLDKSPISFLHANLDLIYSHTTKLDRFLGALFYWMLVATGIGLIVWTFLT